MPPITTLTCPVTIVNIAWRVVRNAAFSGIHILLDTEDPVSGSFLADSGINRVFYNTQDGFFSNIAAIVPPIAQYSVTPTIPDAYPNATIGNSVSFDGSASTGAVNYKWDFGDGAPKVQGATATTTHTYNPTVPTPTLSIAENTTTPFKLKAVGLNITASDPGGFVAATMVNWGDGTVVKLPAALSFPNSSPPLVSINHAYPSVGSFRVNVTATNAVAVRSVLTVNGTTPGSNTSASKMIILGPGKSVSAFATIRVQNALPIVSFAPDKATAFKGDTITLTITSSDADGLVTNTRVDWGDGTVHSLVGAAATDTHSYTNKGSYTANVTVTDDDGGKAWKATPLTIQDRAPLAGFSWTPISPVVGDTVTFTDSSTDADGSVTSWSWNFGDGATSTSKNPTHTYSTAGTFTVKLNVTDNDGSWNVLSRTVTVTTVSAAPFLGGPIVWAGIGIVAALAVALLVWQLVLKKRKTPSPAVPAAKPPGPSTGKP
jgi:PKD repeat protein